jgi:NAD(P)-dependent dehydrogenase (short-subunit alcohol dehydrogenase family)
VTPTAAVERRPDGASRLAGRRVLVVGAGQQSYLESEPPAGIGYGICLRAAQLGAKLAVADRDPEAAERTVAAVRAESGTAVAAIGDASSEEDMERIVTEAAAGLGGLDGLVMNLGIAGGIGLAGTTAETWDAVMAINARAHFLGCKFALPLMSEGASIVLVSSTAAVAPSTSDVPAYIASKAALSGLALHTAREGAAAGVRVNVVKPGLIDTPLGRLGARLKPGRDAIPVPLGRQGNAWEVADAVAFLLSEESSYITGQELVVDGGLTAVI